MEGVFKKINNVNILSNITLNPCDETSQNLSPTVFPRKPFSQKDEISCGFVETIENLRDSSSSNHTKSSIFNDDFKNYVTSDLLKRKVNDKTNQDTSKKKLKTCDKSNDKLDFTEELVFNYKTGAYEPVSSKSKSLNRAQSPEEVCSTTELNILENKFEKALVDGKNSIEIIDLTDEADSELKSLVKRNNMFINTSTFQNTGASNGKSSAQTVLQKLTTDHGLKLKCKICHFRTDFLSIMEKHETSHKNKPSYNTTCTKVYKNYYNNVTRVKIANCEVFQKRSIENSSNGDQISELRKNITAIGKEKKIKTLYCFLCTHTASSRAQLIQHSIVHNNETFFCDKHPFTPAKTCPKCSFGNILQEVSRGIMVCPDCGFKTLKKLDFGRHKKQKCGVEKVASHGVSKKKELGPNKGIDVRANIYNFRCYDCGLEYINQYALEKHVYNIHGDSTFRCEHTAFNDSCRKCTYQYILAKKIGKKTLLCNRCDFHCDDLELMRDHIKTNTTCKSISFWTTNADYAPESSSEINFCHHAPSDKNNLKSLGNSKSNPNIPNNFKCFDCTDKAFSVEKNLKKHILNKHKHSVFKCDSHPIVAEDDCRKCYYLYVLQQTFGRLIFLCPICKETPKSNHIFSSQSNLKKHIHFKHTGVSFKCLDHKNSRIYDGCTACLFEKILNDFRLNTSVKCRCCECSFEGVNEQELEVHVRVKHAYSKFQCSSHILGDIDDNCEMCMYERMVVLMDS